MKIILVAIIAVLIFLGIRIIRLGLKYLANRYPRFDIWIEIFMIAEYIIWTIFVFRSANYLFHEKSFYQYLDGGLILVAVGFLTWFLVRDIFAGFVFRVKYRLKPGSFISAGNISGQIKSHLFTSVKLITTDGLLLYVPYSKLVNEVIIEKGFHGTPKEHTLQICAESSLGRPETEELIKSVLLGSPWSNLKEEPGIRFEKENEKGYFFEIKLFSVKKTHLKFIENAINKVPSLHVISQSNP